MSKVLLHSNSPWVSSGYGQQTALLSERLKADHDVAISAFHGLQGSPLDWSDIMIYPAGAHPYGMDVIAAHAKHHFEGQRGLVLTLIDVWVLSGKNLRDLPLACWVPLDHLSMQPAVKQFLTESECVPIAMSKFGSQQMMDEGFDPLYVPHGIDTETFKKLDSDQCREDLSIPQDAFIVGMVAANQGEPSRKCFPEAFMAMKQLMKSKDDVYLYLHTDTSGLRGHGIDLVRLANECDIPEKRIIECDQYLYHTGMLSPNYMARVYNCMDVLLNPSMGEGFGIPILEAQACGVPVIATNCTAMIELVRIGWLVSGQRFYTGLGQFQMIPDVSELSMVLNYAYDGVGVGSDRAASDFAKEYDVDYVYEHYWKSAIRTISERVRSKQLIELSPV